jgi:2-iminobutanoate/2-iminopropanoate deaminase
VLPPALFDNPDWFWEIKYPVFSGAMRSQQEMVGPIFHMIDAAPEPVAPFSHAAEIDGWVFVTGQLPIDAANEEGEIRGEIEQQTQKVFENLTAVLSGIGMGLQHVVCARVYLTHFERDYARMNAAYASYFKPGRLPARTCVGVTALACDALVEIDFIARRPNAR